MITLTNESKVIFENQTKLDKLNMRHREMIQELKDKEFQLECIQQLLTNSICNEVTTRNGRSIKLKSMSSIFCWHTLQQKFPKIDATIQLKFV